MVQKLWDKYHLPDYKRQHSTLVAAVALFFAKNLISKGFLINTNLLEKAALLHDIDKAIPTLPGEHHPDTGVRILHEEGLHDIANLVKTHSLPAILDARVAPNTWEEKLLYLADKMVKDTILTVDKRIALWEAEGYPVPEYHAVKKLEQEIFSYLDLQPEDVARRITL